MGTPELPENTLTGPRSSRPVRHHRDVSGFLDWTRGRLRNLRLLEGISLMILFVAVVVVGLCVLDNLFHFRQEARLVLLVASVVVLVAGTTYWLLLRPLRTLGDEECAVLLERHSPEFENRLVNTVYFDRSHGRHERRGVEGAFMELVEEEAIEKLRAAYRREIFDHRKAIRLGLATGVFLVLAALYALVFPRHFQNAMSRFLRPLAHVPPITETILHVQPGDTVLSPGESLEIAAEVEGRLPEKALLHLSYGASPHMRFDGRAFSHRVERPTGDFTYWVAAGDAESEVFSVRVRHPPEVKELDVTVTSPSYTTWPPRIEKGSSGNVAALKGSTITLEVRTTVPAREGTLVVRGGGPTALEQLAADLHRVDLELETDVEYSFHFVGHDGSATPQADFARKLTAVPDRPPSCRIVDAPKGTTTGDGGLPLTLQVSDDVGLREALILVARPQATDQAPASERGEAPPGRWSEAARVDDFHGEKEAIPSLLVDLDDALRLAAEQSGSLERPVGVPAAARSSPSGAAPDGAAIAFCACAVDLLGQRSYSGVRRVRLLGAGDATARARRELEEIRQSLAAVLRREQSLHAKTREAVGATNLPDFDARVKSLASDQQDIRELCLGVLAGGEFGWTDSEARRARHQVARAAREFMPLAANQLVEAGLVDVGRRPRSLENALRTERQIILILQRALGLVDAALEKDGSPPGDEAEGTHPRLRGVDERLRELVADLRRFAREQTEVIARTRELEGLTPEDFTAEEKEALEDLAAVEENWGKYLEEKNTDLSKVAPQDMSLGTLLEEVIELIEEIDLAKNYLEGKNIELAVPTEQAGAELAEEIRTNIERWLLRDRDRLKWVMEEPTVEFDVPLADLPSELEDIVGELIDQEELMSAETEDITSSWLDSIDAGIGWDAMDGPISNMSAKGVTGNLQPNDMEIGGRAGEGRSGKSQGQFVEETATGKGGRQTPSRSTPDPFEAGEVKDTGRDPTGGSTGGGKLSGAGEQGLRGQPSPELNRRMGTLAARQTGIRQQAEKVHVALRRRRYYPQNLARSIELMRKMEENLVAGRPYRYETLRQRITSELRATGQLLASQLDHKLERERSLPPKLEDELLNARGEDMPQEFRDLIRNYYRSLVVEERTEPRKP